MRAVEASWRAPGSKLYHAVGAWPLVLRDHTQMQEIEPDRRMLMTCGCRKRRPSLGGPGVFVDDAADPVITIDSACVAMVHRLR